MQKVSQVSKYFFKFMIQDDKSSILDLFTNITELKVFNEILKSCNRNELKWVHTKMSRDLIINKLEISEISFKVRLNKMVSNGIFTKVERGVYIINSEYIIYGK